MLNDADENHALLRHDHYGRRDLRHGPRDHHGLHVVGTVKVVGIQIPPASHQM